MESTKTITSKLFTYNLVDIRDKFEEVIKINVIFRVRSRFQFNHVYFSISSKFERVLKLSVNYNLMNHKFVVEI